MLGAIGGSAGLVIGGLLTIYASWRWTLAVNVPIGAAVALAAPFVLSGPSPQHARLDLVGAMTGTAGLGALVFGLSRAAPSSAFDVPHWGSADVAVALAAAVVLLAAFGHVERRSSQPQLPPRLCAGRTRNAGYITAAVVGGAVLAILFFMTLFFQDVWGYSAVRSGVGFLPWW